MLDAAASFDGSSATVFAVNRSVQSGTELTIDVHSLGLDGDISAKGVWDADRSAANTLARPDRVTLRDNDSARRDGDSIIIDLPPASWTAITLS